MAAVIIAIAIGVLIAAFCFTTAKKKGKNPILFGLLGLVLPLIGLIVVLVIKKEEPQSI